MPALRVAEFYSGIGGMHFALKSALGEGQVVCAFDINDLANRVYRHNFPSVKVMQRNIEALPKSLFEALRADLWTMSPPCQPYTRQGKQQGSHDPRSKSFSFLLDLLPTLTNKPQHILIENVAGFERSDTRSILVQRLAELGYKYEEFLINPLQIGYPNSRTRYYLLAKLLDGPALPAVGNVIAKACETQFRHTIPDLDYMALPVIDPVDGLVNFERSAWDEKHVRPIQDYLEPDFDLTSEHGSKYRIDHDLLEKRGWVFDVVTPQSRRSCCFTKSYHKYAEGTGSVLQFRGEAKPGAQTIDNTRYFTEREVARLMGFPDEFQFPSSVTLQQRYRLLGNSLNVAVVAHLMAYLVNRM
ncbi:hypothetical protein EV182_003110 [Spiromyces aspiralis]|uniref:Uncharacterized protein n=1 Tax=Spiromyces aspiralis TaxID=68401 RepID=A0ACC1HR24_9FUNG|nr:hypothetical protein EV182_003110 [Spiromyces aspiralis]